MTVGSCDTLLKMMQIQDSLEPCQMDHPCRQHREIIRNAEVNVSSAGKSLTYADCHRPNIRAAHPLSNTLGKLPCILLFGLFQGESTLNQIVHSLTMTWVASDCGPHVRWVRGQLEAWMLLGWWFVYLRCVRLKHFLNQFHQPARIAWNILKALRFVAFVWGIFILPRSNSIFSSSWYKNLLHSWTITMAAGSFHLLRPTCLRQIPNYFFCLRS